MNILFDIGHPAHVLLFKDVISELNNYHTVFVSAKNKDIVYKLLDEYNINYVPLGCPYNSFIKKNIFSCVFVYKIVNIMHKYKIDVVVSNTSFYAAIAAFILGKESITLLSVDKDLYSFVFKLVPTNIVTSMSYSKNIKNDQIKINTVFETAYINPQKIGSLKINYFDRLNFNNVFIRFVEWNAYDDMGKRSLSNQQKIDIVKRIENIGKKVVVSSEKESKSFQDNILKCNVSKFHEYLYNNISFYIGDSGSVASECALLGIPAIYISNKKHGFLDYLENQYNLVKCFQVKQFKSAIKFIEESIMSSNFFENHHKMRERFFSRHVDMSKFLFWYIDKYPESRQIINKDPNYQNRFLFSK